MRFTDIRIKIRHWFRKYKKIFFIIFIIWFGIFLINLYFSTRTVKPVAETTYEAHTSVINSDTSTPKILQVPIEDLIKKYVDYCNDGNFQAAYDLLSDDCKKYAFNNSIDNFMKHVYSKMPTPKHYAIQSYSNINFDRNKIYIYEIKYTDDLLATGLTNTTYTFTSEKMSFYRDEEDNLKMNVGDYIISNDIKSISENEYLKIDVMNRKVNYKTETYEVKFTNRSNYNIVISDSAENQEILLTLPKETRDRTILGNVVLKPQEVQTYTFEFPKFVDDGDETQSLLFSSIRVMEKYSGVEDIPEEKVQSEIDNAISKFSMSVNIAK